MADTQQSVVWQNELHNDDRRVTRAIQIGAQRVDGFRNILTRLENEIPELARLEKNNSDARGTLREVKEKIDQFEEKIESRLEELDNLDRRLQDAKKMDLIGGVDEQGTSPGGRLQVVHARRLGRKQKVPSQLVLQALSIVNVAIKLNKNDLLVDLHPDVRDVLVTSNFTEEQARHRATKKFAEDCARQWYRCTQEKTKLEVDVSTLKKYAKNLQEKVRKKDAQRDRMEGDNSSLRSELSKVTKESSLFQQQNEQLRKLLGESQSSVTTYQNKLNDLQARWKEFHKDEMTDKDKEFQTVSRELDEVKERVGRRNNTIYDLQKKMREAESKLGKQSEEETKKLSGKDEIITAGGKRILELETAEGLRKKDVESLHSTVQAQKQLINKLKREHKEVQDRNNVNESTITRNNERVLEYKATIIVKQKNIQDLEDDAANLKKVNKALNGDINSLQKRVNEFIVNNTKFNSKMRELEQAIQKQTNDNSTLADKVSRLTTTIQGLEENKQSLQDELREMDKQNSTLEKQNSMLEKQKSTLEKQKSMLEKQKSTLEIEIEKQLSNIDEQKNLLKAQDLDKEKLKELISKQENTLREQKSDKKNQEAKLRELHSKEEGNKNKLIELQSYQENYKGELRELYSNQENYKSELRELISNQENYKSELRELRSEQETNRNKLRELISNQENYKRELRELLSKQETNRNKLRELQSYQENYKSELRELHSEQETYKNKLTELTSKVEINGNKLRELHSTQETYKNKLTEINKHSSDIEQQVDELAEQKSKTERQKNTLESQLAQKKSLLETLESEYNSLKDLFDTTISEIEVAQQDMNRQIIHTRFALTLQTIYIRRVKNDNVSITGYLTDAKNLGVELRENMTTLENQVTELKQASISQNNEIKNLQEDKSRLKVQLENQQVTLQNEMARKRKEDLDVNIQRASNFFASLFKEKPCMDMMWDSVSKTLLSAHRWELGQPEQVVIWQWQCRQWSPLANDGYEVMFRRYTTTSLVMVLFVVVFDHQFEEPHALVLLQELTNRMYTCTDALTVQLLFEAVPNILPVIQGHQRSMPLAVFAFAFIGLFITAHSRFKALEHQQHMLKESTVQGQLLKLISECDFDTRCLFDLFLTMRRSTPEEIFRGVDGDFQTQYYLDESRVIVVPDDGDWVLWITAEGGQVHLLPKVAFSRDEEQSTFVQDIYEIQGSLPKVFTASGKMKWWWRARLDAVLPSTKKEVEDLQRAVEGESLILNLEEE